MTFESGPLEERSQFARNLAEKALVALMTGLEGQDLPMIVLGGLVPQVLTSGQVPPAPEHLGTNDVDIHLALGVDPDRDFGAVEEVLQRKGFSPDMKVDGWRWRGVIDDYVVKVEFLCDLDDRPANQSMSLRGCDRLKAANLRGTGFVADDYEWQEVSSQGSEGVRVRFAGLQGYLLSKAFAARHRGEGKDYYDLVYTLLYNRLGGPKEVAEALAAGRFHERIKLTLDPWPEIRARFTDPSDFGPVSYAESALLADPTGDTSVFRQDAVGAVSDFFAILEPALRQ